MPVERRYWKTEPGFARTLTETVDRLTKRRDTGRRHHHPVAPTSGEFGPG